MDADAERQPAEPPRAPRRPATAGPPRGPDPEADRRDAAARTARLDERERRLDRVEERRNADHDDRDHAADERDRVADARERLADLREVQADVREVAALERLMQAEPVGEVLPRTDPGEP